MRIDDKDKEIIACLVSGLTIKEVASKVFLSHYTVIDRIEKMKEEFDVRNIPALVHKLHKANFFS